jgi:gluconokinase
MESGRPARTSANDQGNADMIVILMGVTGSGKTTIGKLLSRRLRCPYYDADDFHSEANVKKMRSGVPLTDQDRLPWLESLRQLILDCLDRRENAVLACSALKESYRKLLMVDDRVHLVYLSGNHNVIEQRLARRRGHYMNPSLLASQFETLEEPSGAIQVDIARSPGQIVNSIVKSLREGGGVDARAADDE